MKLSVIILAGNREDIIEFCLKSLDWVDEKLLVDLGSTDKTLAIAKKYNCRIIKGDREYNFSRWRNQGAKSAKNEWLLYIDTDERVTKSLRDEISSEVLNPPKRHLGDGVLKHLRGGGTNAYYLPRKNYFLGKEFKTVYPDYQLRLIKKKALAGWRGKIHELPKVKGRIGKLKNPLIHLSHRSLESSIKNTLNWSKLEAENRLKAGHPKMTGWRFLRIIFTGFYQQFVKKRVWREGTEGVIEGIYQMFSLFITYVRLWEMQRRESLETTYKKIDYQIC